MAFLPEVNEQLIIDGVAYSIAEHPFARGMPYGQEGRAAVVYQLIAGDEKRALKVFKPRFRVPGLVSLSRRLEPFAALPGLRVCRRAVLTSQGNADLLRRYPDLSYAVLMPWIEGPTWMEVLLEERELSPQQSLALARAFAVALSHMEQESLAHCDLSGPNVLLPGLAGEWSDSGQLVELVDVEQMYGPDLRKPEFVASGSLGYAHKTAPEGLWSAEADRFAGAVMLAEMLGWCDPRVRANGWSESYFDPEEMQREGVRYQSLMTVLRERWGDGIARLFERAWASDTLSFCATFDEWLFTLPEEVPAPAQEAASHTPSKVESVPPTPPGVVVGGAETRGVIEQEAAQLPAMEKGVGAASPVGEAADSPATVSRDEVTAGVHFLMQQAAAEPDPVRALALYREALSLAPQGSELSARLAQTVRQMSGPQPEPQQPALPAPVAQPVTTPPAVAPPPASTPPAQRVAASSSRRGGSRFIVPGILVALLLLFGGMALFLTQVNGVGTQAEATATPTSVAEVVQTPTLIALNTEAVPTATSPASALDEITVLGVYTYPGQVRAIAFSPDGTMLALGSSDGTIRIINPTDGALRRSAQVNTSRIESLAFSPDGRILVAGSWDGNIYVWDVAGEETRPSNLEGHKVTVESVAFSPAAGTQIFASASSDGAVRLWVGGTSNVLEGNEANVTELAFSPDGLLLAGSAADGAVLIWRVADGELLHTMKARASMATGVAFSPDGQTLASASSEGVIDVWSVEEGRPLRVLEGHTEKVTDLSFSPDRKTLVSVSEDATVRLWRVSDGKLVHTIEGVREVVWRIAFSPDGHLLALGSLDGTVLLWAAPSATASLRRDTPTPPPSAAAEATAGPLSEDLPGTSDFKFIPRPPDSYIVEWCLVGFCSDGLTAAGGDGADVDYVQNVIYHRTDEAAYDMDALLQQYTDDLTAAGWSPGDSVEFGENKGRLFFPPDSLKGTVRKASVYVWNDGGQRNAVTIAVVRETKTGIPTDLSLFKEVQTPDQVDPARELAVPATRSDNDLPGVGDFKQLARPANAYIHNWCISGSCGDSLYSIGAHGEDQQHTQAITYHPEEGSSFDRDTVLWAYRELLLGQGWTTLNPTVISAGPDASRGLVFYPPESLRGTIRKVGVGVWKTGDKNAVTLTIVGEKEIGIPADLSMFSEVEPPQGTDPAARLIGPGTRSNRDSPDTSDFKHAPRPKGSFIKEWCLQTPCWDAMTATGTHTYDFTLEQGVTYHLENGVFDAHKMMWAYQQAMLDAGWSLGYPVLIGENKGLVFYPPDDLKDKIRKLGVYFWSDGGGGELNACTIGTIRETPPGEPPDLSLFVGH